jgi:hypothetical protein
LHIRDDILIASNNEEIKNLKKYLAGNFKVKDLAELHYIPGIRVTRNREEKEIQLDHSNFIQQCLKKFNLMDANPICTPAEEGENFVMQDTPSNVHTLDVPDVSYSYLSAV